MNTLIGIILLLVYSYCAWMFWQGFERTNFNRSLPTRLSLALLWPVLVIANKSYRRNFIQALKG